MWPSKLLSNRWSCQRKREKAARSRQSCTRQTLRPQLSRAWGRSTLEAAIQMFSERSRLRVLHCTELYPRHRAAGQMVHHPARPRWDQGHTRLSRSSWPTGCRCTSRIVAYYPEHQSSTPECLLGLAASVRAVALLLLLATTSATIAAAAARRAPVTAAATAAVAASIPTICCTPHAVSCSCR